MHGMHRFFDYLCLFIRLSCCSLFVLSVSVSDDVYVARILFLRIFVPLISFSVCLEVSICLSLSRSRFDAGFSGCWEIEIIYLAGSRTKLSSTHSNRSQFLDMDTNFYWVTRWICHPESDDFNLSSRAEATHKFQWSKIQHRYQHTSLMELPRMKSYYGLEVELVKSAKKKLTPYGLEQTCFGPADQDFDH